MADTKINPWKFTNADENTVPFTLLDLAVQSIRWVGAVGQTDKVILKDAAGNVVWESVAPAPVFESVNIRRPFDSSLWKGLIVDTLDSGTVYLELM